MIINIFICVASTLSCYFVSLKLFRKYNKSWLNPLYFASFLLIVLLLGLQIHESTYKRGSFIFSELLQLAVVSLAVPLYKQWSYVKQHFKKICSGVLCGTVFGIVSAVVMGQIFQFNQQLLASLIPKSVTLPIALTISNELGGLTSTTVFFVLSSALISLIIGPNILKRFGIQSKAAKGIAMGVSAQMLGANKSFQWGEEEGAMGSVAMTTTALFLSLLIPLLSLILKI